LDFETVQKAGTPLPGPLHGGTSRRSKCLLSPTAQVHEPPPPRLPSGQTDDCTPDPIPGRRSRPPPDPVLVDGEEEYEVEAVINSRMF